MKTVKIKHSDNVTVVAAAFIEPMMKFEGKLPSQWEVIYEGVTYEVLRHGKAMPMVIVHGEKIEHDVLVMIMQYTGSTKLAITHGKEEYHVKFVRFSALKKLLLVTAVGGAAVGGYLWIKGRVGV